jgi:hypothetical protein
LRLGRAVKPGRRRMLLWASPLQGSSPHGLSRPSPPLLSRAYQPGRRWPTEPITPQSVNRRAAFRALADPAPLLGFYTSSCSTVQTTNDPGYVFTSPATAIAGGLTDSLGRRGLTGVDRTDDRRRAKAEAAYGVGLLLFWPAALQVLRSVFATPGFPVLPVTADPSGCPFVPVFRQDIPGRSVFQAPMDISRRIWHQFQITRGRSPLFSEAL